MAWNWKKSVKAGLNVLTGAQSALKTINPILRGDAAHGVASVFGSKGLKALTFLRNVGTQAERVTGSKAYNTVISEAKRIRLA